MQITKDEIECPTPATNVRAWLTAVYTFNYECRTVNPDVTFGQLFEDLQNKVNICERYNIRTARVMDYVLVGLWTMYSDKTYDDFKRLWLNTEEASRLFRE